MKYICLIALIVIIGIILFIKAVKDNKDFNPDELSARNYWRWKNGGID